jgi:hypothetical protein
VEHDLHAAGDIDPAARSVHVLEAHGGALDLV